MIIRVIRGQAFFVNFIIVPVFNFKRFSINDDRSAMKVGTDAVLLGTWVNIADAKSILDIGTGCGVIALVLAQRSAGDVLIDAIEMRKEDAEQAAQNILSSPWPQKITVHHARLQEYFPPNKYDLIVCNPPYFSGSQLPPKKERASVRHDIALGADELFSNARRLLAASGRVNLILPAVDADRFTARAHDHKFFLRRRTLFCTRVGKDAERSLIEFNMDSGPANDDSLLLYEQGDHWSEAYRTLVGDFYLDR